MSLRAKEKVGKLVLGVWPSKKNKHIKKDTEAWSIAKQNKETRKEKRSKRKQAKEAAKNAGKGKKRKGEGSNEDLKTFQSKLGF